MQGCHRNCKGCRVGKRSPQAPPERRHRSVWKQIQSSRFSVWEALLLNDFQQRLWVSYHKLLPEMLLEENGIWSSKEEERRTKSRCPKSVFFTWTMVILWRLMHSCLLHSMEEAAGVAGQWHSWAEWRSCSLTGQAVVWASPREKAYRSQANSIRTLAATRALWSFLTTTNRQQVNHSLQHEELQVWDSHCLMVAMSPPV